MEKASSFLLGSGTLPFSQLKSLSRRREGQSDLPLKLLSFEGMKSPSHPAIREVLQKTPEGRSLLREEQLAKVRACQDIVHDFDDPDDFSLWREVFASSRSWPFDGFWPLPLAPGLLGGLFLSKAVGFPYRTQIWHKSLSSSLLAKSGLPARVGILYIGGVSASTEGKFPRDSLYFRNTLMANKISIESPW